MHVPADAHRIVAHQRLLVEQRLQKRHRRQQDHHDERHACELPAFGLQEGLAVLHRQPVDDAAEEAEHPHFGKRDRGDEDRRPGDVWPGAPRIMQAKRDQRLRRLHRISGRERVETTFKPAEHAKYLSGFWAWSRAVQAARLPLYSTAGALGSVSSETETSASTSQT